MINTDFTGSNILILKYSYNIISSYIYITCFSTLINER